MFSVCFDQNKSHFAKQSIFPAFLLPHCFQELFLSTGDGHSATLLYFIFNKFAVMLPEHYNFVVSTSELKQKRGFKELPEKKLWSDIVSNQNIAKLNLPLDFTFNKINKKYLKKPLFLVLYYILMLWIMKSF